MRANVITGKALRSADQPGDGVDGELREDGDATLLSLSSLTPDPQNARRPDDRHLALIEQALREVGAARSVVVDEAGTILAGDATMRLDDDAV